MVNMKETASDIELDDDAFLHFQSIFIKSDRQKKNLCDTKRPPRHTATPSKKGKWDGRSHRTPNDEVTSPEVLAVPLGMSEDGEGGV